MPTVHFQATAHPTIAKLTIRNIPDIKFEEPPYLPDLPKGIKIDYKITVVGGHIDILADIEDWDESKLSWIHNRVSMMIRGLIDLYCFGAGQALIVTMDSYTAPDGVIKHLLISDPRLTPHCTFMIRTPNGVDFGKSLGLMITEPNLALAMRDLISGITFPNTAVIDCARAVEGIRQLIDPNVDKRGSGWGKLQEALNVDRSYREYVTGIAANPRHGDKAYISGDVVNEVTQRSWEIMNRFIEYRLRGLTKLPLAEFPLLT